MSDTRSDLATSDGSSDDEMRGRLLDAAARCIVRSGTARIRMGEVATEACVARSTLYRYFPSRDDLIVGLFLARIDAALDSVVAELPQPDRAAASLPDLVLKPHAMIEGSPLNEAMFSPDSRELVALVELHSEPLFNAVLRHYAPLLLAWSQSGQLHADLELREAARWVHSVSLMLLNPPWVDLSTAARRGFLVRYLVRALVVPEHW